MWDNIFLFVQGHFCPRKKLSSPSRSSPAEQRKERAMIERHLHRIPTFFQEDASQLLLDVGQCVSRLLQVLQKQIIGTM
jgi:hypothetical protein